MKNIGETKRRIKMYKAGKMWLFSASATVAMLGTGVGIAHADSIAHDVDSSTSGINAGSVSQAASQALQTPPVADPTFSSQASTVASDVNGDLSQQGTVKSVMSTATYSDSSASQSSMSQAKGQLDSVSSTTSSVTANASSTASSTASVNMQNLGNATDGQVASAKSAAVQSYGQTNQPQVLTRMDAQSNGITTNPNIDWSNWQTSGSLDKGNVQVRVYYKDASNGQDLSPNTILGQTDALDNTPENNVNAIQSVTGNAIDESNKGYYLVGNDLRTQDGLTSQGVGSSVTTKISSTAQAIVFWYSNAASVNVNYETSDGTKLAPSTVVTSTTGGNYETTLAYVANYHVVSTPTNATGTFAMPNGLQAGTTPDVTYLYVPDTQYAYVSYVDDTLAIELDKVLLSGVGGTTSPYRTAAEIQKWENAGYEFVSQDYPSAGVVFDINNLVNQLFTVHLKHAIKPITPSNPGTPGQPIDPSNPAGPKWPNGSDLNSLSTSINERVHYVMSDGSTAPVDQTDQTTFTRNGTVDEVTGKLKYTSWVATDGKTSFSAKVTPEVKGYYADQAQIDEITGLTATSGDKNFTVTYKTLASLVPTPSDPSDPNWPKVPSVAYPNDP
ncbi:mucin-binding protein, partial [Furfurilactobacillus sp. WILCCON 0119]